MYTTAEQFAASNKAGVEALVGLAQTQFTILERLATLNFNATKSLFEDGAEQAKTLLGAKDAQELVDLSASAGQPALEKMVAYSRSVYELSTQAQDDLRKMFEAQAADFNKNAFGFLDKLSDSAPAGSDVAVAAVKSAIAAANTAYEGLSKVAKQASQIAEANFAAVTSATREAKRKAA